jgi:MFS family permease
MRPRETPPARGTAAEAALLSLAGFFGIFSTTMSKSPVLPLFAQALGGSATLIGAISSISPIAGIVFSFPVGLLADRLGKKRLLVAASAVFAAAPLLYLVVTAPALLIPLRFFHGIATATLAPVAAAFLASAYPTRRAEMIGLYSSATLFGRTLAPLLGGALISLFAFLGGVLNYRVVYAAAFLLALPVVFLCLSLRDDGGAAGVKGLTVAAFGRGLLDFLKNARLLGTSLVEMCTYFAYGCLETYLPLHLAARGVPAWGIGVLFSLQVLSIALSKPLFGRLADRVDRRVQILVGIVLCGVFIALIPLSDNVVILGGVSILFGLGVSISTVATSAFAADVAASDRLGASLGALSSIMDIGHSSGPFVAGVVITATSLAGGFLTAAAACAAGALAFLLTSFRHPRR